MIYFTSDLHLGHANAIKFTNRPFADVEEMNDALIRNINETVGAKDELWVLGDFAYRIGKEAVRGLRDRIQCGNVHLVRGNHDRKYDSDDVFQSVQDYKELKTDYGRFILFHYPIREWNAAHYGSVHLHGHIHSNGDYNAENLQKSFASAFHQELSPKSGFGLRIYDVGVDANGYRPVSLERIAGLMRLSPAAPRQ